MLQVTIDASDLNLIEYEEKIDKNIISISGEKLNELLRKNSPKRSGQGANSWVVNNTDDKKVTIRNTAEYMKYVNNGTGVYSSGNMIVPSKPNGVLVFQSGGQTVFTRKVKGQKGQKFVEKSLKEFEGELPNIVLFAQQQS